MSTGPRFQNRPEPEPVPVLSPKERTIPRTGPVPRHDDGQSGVSSRAGDAIASGQRRGLLRSALVSALASEDHASTRHAVSADSPKDSAGSPVNVQPGVQRDV
jgi:hypothetical protein